MKLVYSLFLLLVLLITAAFYLDKMNEARLYDLCTSYAIGNPRTEVEMSVNQTQFDLDKSQPDTLLVFIAAYLPWSKGFTCEIKYSQEKVSQINFIVD